MEEQIRKMLLDFSKEVNQAILDNKFEVMERGEHTIKIKVLGEVVYMWNANEAKDTYCYDIYLIDSRISFPYHTFKKPATCRKLLRVMTDKEKDIKKDCLGREIKKLSKQLKEV